MKKKHNNRVNLCFTFFMILVETFLPEKLHAADDRSLRINHAITVLDETGIVGFASICKFSDTELEPPSFEAEDAGLRKLGERLISTCNALSLECGKDGEIFDALTQTEKWILKRTGAHNLVLAYATEKAAWRILAKSLLSQNSEVSQTRERISLLRELSPDRKYWTIVATQEWTTAHVDEIQFANQPEYLKFSAVLNALASMDPPLGGRADVPTASPDVLHRLFAVPDVSLAYLLAVNSAIYATTLDAVTEVIIKTGKIPDDEETFVSSLERLAPLVLRKRDRLGGRMPADQAWSIWRELTK